MKRIVLSTVFTLVLVCCAVFAKTQTASADSRNRNGGGAKASVSAVTQVRKAVCSHNYVMKETKAATCVQAGTQMYVCTKCGALKPGGPVVTIPPTNKHNWQYQSSRSSTCTTKGYHFYKCLTCGTTKKENRAIDPNAHNYKITLEKNATKFSHVSYKCSYCGKVIDKSMFASRMPNFRAGIIYIVGSDIQEFKREMEWYLDKIGPTYDKFDNNNNADYGSNWLLTAIRKCMNEAGASSVKNLSLQYKYSDKNAFNNIQVLTIELSNHVYTDGCAMFLNRYKSSAEIPTDATWKLLK